MVYQPQQIGVITEMAGAMEDRQITALEMQRIMDASLAFGMSVIFGIMMGALLRTFLREVLEPEEKKVIRPAIDAILPATERGELLVRYTGGPQHFAFPEGLEGEIRNFAGHDWVILDTPRNRQIIREDRRWVVARQQPAHLRRRSPGLLPATTCTAEQIFTRAKEYFGATTNPNEAGYILPDGTMLDFSGKRFGGSPGRRELDHRDIAFAWPEDDCPGGFEAMAQVMNWGAVRFSTYRETMVVDLVQLLTGAQKKAIDRALWYNPDAVLVVQVDDAGLTQIDYQEFTHPFNNWKAFAERAVATRRVSPQTSPLPQARSKDIDTLDRLIKEKHRDPNWEKWPQGSISDARKAVYKDILNGFSTIAEAREYVEGLPEDSVIFTARGDEIPFSLIKVIIADIERNPWSSPFRPERRPDISWQPPLMPQAGYKALRLFDDKEPFMVYLRPNEQVAAATKFRMAHLETIPGYKYTVFMVIQEKGVIIDIQAYHVHEDPKQDYHVYWLPHYRPPDEIMTRIEKDTGFKFPSEIWKKPARFLHLPQTEIYYTISFKGDTRFKAGEIVSETAFKAENERVMKLGLRPARGWISSKGKLRSWGNGLRSPAELEEYLPHSIPRDDLKRIADKYGWWAAKLAEAVCPHNDVACVEREARRLAEARRARLE